MRKYQTYLSLYILGCVLLGILLVYGMASNTPESGVKSFQTERFFVRVFKALIKCAAYLVSYVSGVLVGRRKSREHMIEDWELLPDTYELEEFDMFEDIST